MFIDWFNNKLSSFFFFLSFFLVFPTDQSHEPLSLKAPSAIGTLISSFVVIIIIIRNRQKSNSRKVGQIGKHVTTQVEQFKSGFRSAESKMVENIKLISAQVVADVLTYDDLIPVIESALGNFSSQPESGIIQPVRTILRILTVDG